MKFTPQNTEKRRVAGIRKKIKNLPERYFLKRHETVIELAGWEKVKQNTQGFNGFKKLSRKVRYIQIIRVY